MTKRLVPLGTVTVLALLGAGPLAGQARPLAPLPERGLPVTPFLEGWYPNPDGSYDVSMGYLNRNRSEVVRIPVGESNRIEPGAYSGNQPTVFLPGRHRGVFVVRVPAGAESTEAWWTIVNQNGETHRVPIRVTTDAYELDRNPRPTGTLPPRMAFAERGPWGSDPAGITAERTLSARVGERVLLEVWVEDPSQRDPADHRSVAAMEGRVVWMPHQAPPEGGVEFSRHESTPAPEPPAASEGPRRPAPPPGPNEVTLPTGKGVARVYATFDAPGEYLLRAQADNWRAPDSSSADQCCWSNAFVRVNVQP